MIDDARMEELKAIGHEAGYTMALMFSAMLGGFMEGMRDHTVDTYGNPDEEIDPPDIKTQIEDCRRCWCDTCANIEECTYHWTGEVSDGSLPSPCTGCKNGMRGMPMEHEAMCEAYEPFDGHNKG